MNPPSGSINLLEWPMELRTSLLSRLSVYYKRIQLKNNQMARYKGRVMELPCPLRSATFPAFPGVHQPESSPKPMIQEFLWKRHKSLVFWINSVSILSPPQ